MADEQADTPWSDCKVAFGVDDVTCFERWMERTDDGKGLLPSGWSLCETDGSGARYVAVFRVEGVPSTEDGVRVFALLSKVGGYRRSRP